MSVCSEISLATTFDNKLCNSQNLSIVLWFLSWSGHCLSVISIGSSVINKTRLISLTLMSDILITVKCQCRISSIVNVRIHTGSSATAEIARDAWNDHSRSLKVIRCCANRRSIYDFVLVLNSII